MNKHKDTQSESRRIIWLLMPVLLVPLVATGVSISLDFGSPLDTSCESIRTFLEETDQIRVTKDANVLILGGATFTQWKFRSARDKMTPQQLRVKASPLIGPHTVARCFERTVAHYQPMTTVLFLDPEDGLAGAEATLNALDEIVQKRTYWSVSPGLVVVPPTVTPSLQGKAVQLADFETRVQNWAADKVGVETFDTAILLSDASGRVDPRLFWPNGSTLGKAGCDRLRARMLMYAGLSDS